MNKRTPFKDLGITSTPWKKENKPEEGKIYALTGNNGNSISDGKTWAESEVKTEDPSLPATTWEDEPF